MVQAEREVNMELVRRYGEMGGSLNEVTTLDEALNLDIETGEHLRMNLGTLDRIIWEEATAITDGKAVFEHAPSSLTPHHRYGMRLNKKYGAGKRAFLAAYMLHMVTGLELESRQWFEGLADESFTEAFDELRKLYSELRKCDARDTDVMGKVEPGIGEGGSYHAVEVLPEDGWEPETQEDTIFTDWKTRIRRAGKHQIGALGKELYGEKRLENYVMTMLWNLYKARKQELQKYWGR